MLLESLKVPFNYSDINPLRVGREMQEIDCDGNRIYLLTPILILLKSYAFY